MTRSQDDSVGFEPSVIDLDGKDQQISHNYFTLTLLITKTQKHTIIMNFATSLAIASTLASASAFTPSTTSNGATALRMADMPMDNEKEWPTVNGWKADPTKFCAGLPGSTAPLGEFDPCGITSEMSIKEIKRYRESEVTHGRVAMLATVGYLVGESSFHPLFGGEVTGPANSHLAQVQEIAPAFFTILVSTIAFAEIRRALVGWKSAEVRSMLILCDKPRQQLFLN